ncbi:uncharacterized protein LOC129752113 [Uranotaenia lowii]|uniref:uncharacterized protein LOC129752113 n=1 Tax=Uranotaenia lowii TaxID=190385 RepID=UPI002479DE8F|nr:uncharacterized protein LOC129752113 [Uranotaenia lowii]
MAAINGHLIELIYLAAQIPGPTDRVRVTEWIRKLKDTHSENLAHPRVVPEYLEYLKLLLSQSPIYFVDPFKKLPPKQPGLVPLAEALGNSLADQCPYLPRTGKVAPVLLHRSGNDSASISVQREADGNVVCYMAISPKDPNI